MYRAGINDLTSLLSGGAVLSEDGILACLSKYFPDRHETLLLGRGDDAAVIRAEKPLCVSSDLFLEDSHFRRAYFTPEEIGHKALAVNVSDMAACGAKPLGFTLCLGLPRQTETAWLEEFFRGMSALAEKSGIVLAGGDLSVCERMHISITIWGEAERGLFLRRGNGRPGDALFATGGIGLARVGLYELEARGREAVSIWPEACAAHLRPRPQTQAGITIVRLADPGRPPALIDVSDGLARDLPRLLQGPSPTRNIGASLRLPPESLHPEVRRFAAELGFDPVSEALLGGEDYALLGSCSPGLLPELQAALPDLFFIGVVTENPEIFVNGKPFNVSGFDHFHSSPVFAQNSPNRHTYRSF
ncbi:MAG: thiamine-phosphate kinase [Desulfovibrio sp.]|nr:thiamine-phosphate kinase [Desulfovibrio sp.]